MPNVRSYEPATITIDGESVALRITRMSLDDWTEYSSKFHAYGRQRERHQIGLDQKRRELAAAITPAEVATRKEELRAWRVRAAGAKAKRLSTDAKPVDPEPITEPTDEEARQTLEPSDGEVLSAIEAELGTAGAKQRVEQEIADTKDGNAFTVDSLTRFVAIEDGQIRDEDTGTFLATGAQLVEKYGSRPDVLSAAMAQIYLMNSLTDEQKKRLSSLRASTPSSMSSAPAPGPTPAAIVESVASSSTAVSEGVTA